MRFLLYLFLTISLEAQPLFNTISLSEFGFLTNGNQTVQPANTFNQNQLLRTNDFQSLQSTFATERQPIRMGNLYVSQGPEGVGLTHPATQDVESTEITTPIDNTRLIFGCFESTSLARLFNAFTNPNDLLPTSQALTLTYYISTNPVPTSTGGSLTMTDYNVIGNAYHDIQYVGLTPTITSNGPTIRRLFVDGRPASLAVPPQRGNKLRFDLSNGQTWLIYVEQSDRPFFFTIGTDTNLLKAQETFTGFLRVATIQTSDIPNTGPTTFRNVTVGDTWSTAAVAQSFPATPIAMYLLWPSEWTANAGSQINNNIARNFLMPECSVITSLLPLLARFDPPTAFLYLARALQYDPGNNPFINAYMMLVAQKLGGAMDTYQSTFRPPPSYGITPSAELTEAAYDAHRSAIPISAEISFAENSIIWTYIPLNSENLVSPLILFPAYKTLDAATHTAVPGFAYIDPIKGDLFAVEAVDNQVTFSEGALPDFYTRDFLPDITFTGAELARLINLFNAVRFNTVDGANLQGAGKDVYELALTAKLALQVLSQAGRSRGAIQNLTLWVLSQVKSTLTSWLITRNTSDFFIGDNLTPGLCTIAGISSSSADTASADNNNSIYSNHHTDYGYWLMAAAFVVQLDEALKTRAPFISLQVTTTAKVKDYVDFLWRDARNPDREDPDLFPFNRHGNPWEGHSTANGMLYTPLSQGRTQELLAEDFNSWAAVREYARAIFAASTLTEEDKMGFDTLATFAETNMQLTATSGKLVYQDDSWIYPFPYTVNTEVGMTADTQTEAATTREPGTPPCQLLVPNNFRR